MKTNHLIEKMVPQKEPLQKSTYIAFVLDESGSMAGTAELTMKSFNDQIDVVKKNEDAGGKTSISFFTFNGEVRTLFKAEPVSQIRKLSNANYNPCGGTALFDGIGEAIASLKTSVGPNEDPAFLVCIFTDGEENASKRYNQYSIRSQIQALQETGDWTFTLMGPKDGVAMLSDQLAIPAANVAGFDPGNTRSRMAASSMDTLKMGSYLNTRSMGMKASAMMYSAQSSAEMASLLASNLVTAVEEKKK